MVDNSSEHGQQNLDYGNWQQIFPQAFSTPPPVPFNFACPPPNFLCPPPAQSSYFAYGAPPPRHEAPSVPFVVPPSLSRPHTLPPRHSTKPPLGYRPPILQKQQQDTAWVTQWLLTKGKTANSKRTKLSRTTKINEARQLLDLSNQCLQELQVIQQEMQHNQDCEVEKWDEMVRKAEDKKGELLRVTSQLECVGSGDVLQTLLKRRAVRRQAQHRRRMELKRQRDAQAASRQAQHLHIDAWRQQRQEEVERVRREEDTRREADAVLGEVRHKQGEGRRWQQLLGALCKLRQLRARAAADKGLRPSQQEDECFDKVVGELGVLWQSQLRVYDAEEHALRVMLEEESVERRHQRKPAQQVAPLVLWEELLFGPSPDTSLHEFQLQTRARSDLHALVNIRCEWDQFVAAAGAVMSSAPPVGWVVPTIASSQDWGSLLSTQASSQE